MDHIAGALPRRSLSQGQNGTACLFHRPCSNHTTPLAIGETIIGFAPNPVRLLFEHQRELARMFGYQDSDMRLAVEQFMKQYYRCALALGQLNEVLMQHFDQVILRADAAEEVVVINGNFQIRNGYIETRSESIFRDDPSALLEIFLHCGQNEAIEGVHVATIRMIREHRDLIDDNFRADPKNRRLFMELLRVSSPRDHRFHRPDCERLTRRKKNKSTVRFSTREAAFDSGRCPCTRCEP